MKPTESNNELIKQALGNAQEIVGSFSASLYLWHAGERAFELLVESGIKDPQVQEFYDESLLTSPELAIIPGKKLSADANETLRSIAETQGMISVLDKDLFKNVMPQDILEDSVKKLGDLTSVVSPLIFHGELYSAAFFHFRASCDADKIKILELACEQLKSIILLDKESRHARSVQQIFDTSEQPTVLFDNDLKITLDNAAVRKEFSSSNSSIVGKNLDDVFSAPVADVFHAHKDAQGQTETSVRHRLDLKNAAGDMHSYDVGFYTVKLDDDQEVHAAVFSRRQPIAGSSVGLQTFRTVIEHAPFGASVVRKDGTIEFVNEKYASIYGYSADELTGQKVSVFYLPEEAEKTKQRVISVFESGSWHGELKGVKKDGTKIDIYLNAYSVKSGADVLPVSIGIIEDITDQKKRENELLEFEKTFDFSSIGLATLDQQRRFTKVNPALCEILEVPAQQLLGHDPYEFLDIVSSAEDAGKVRTVLEAGSPVVREYTMKRSDGVQVPVEVHISGLKSKDGSMLGFVASVINLSVRREHEAAISDRDAALVQAKSDWENTFDTISSGVYIVDCEHTILKANRAISVLLETDFNALIGTKCNESLCAPDGVFNVCKVDCDAPQTVDHQNIASPTLSKFFDISVYPMDLEDGRPKKFVHVVNDVTKENKMRERLVQTEKLSSIGELVAGIAHEINNPLASISGFTQLLLDEERDPELLEQIKKIELSANRAKGIIQNLVHFSSNRSGQKEAVDPNELVNQTVKMKYYSLFVNDIRIDTDMAPGMPKIFADPTQVQQVILNLIDNAEQAILQIRPFGTISVVTRYTDDEIRIIITDNGCGMAKNIAKRVFDPFFTTKGVGSGTGLGLSTAYGMIKDHGGEIRVESDVGIGSTFTVILPIQKYEVEKRDVTPVSSAKDIELRGRNILVIDDEAIIGELISRALEKLGCNVTVANTGIDGIQWLNKKKIDVILTDIKMPGLDGKALFNLLETNYKDYVPRLAFITGDAISLDTSEFLLNSKRPYLIKPFEIKDVVLTCKELIQSQLSASNGSDPSSDSDHQSAENLHSSSDPSDGLQN